LFSSKLQAAGGVQRDARRTLADDTDKPLATQTLFHRRQHMPAGLEVDDALRRQADAGKRPRKQVGPFLPGNEQGRRRAVFDFRTSAGDLGEGVRQAIARKSSLETGEDGGNASDRLPGTDSTAGGDRCNRGYTTG
jgi:hypothetical protein